MARRRRRDSRGRIRHRWSAVDAAHGGEHRRHGGGNLRGVLGGRGVRGSFSLAATAASIFSCAAVAAATFLAAAASLFFRAVFWFNVVPVLGLFAASGGGETGLGRVRRRTPSAG